MNCKVVRSRVLALEQPDQPPPDAAAHLMECVACRDWLQQLLQMERQVSCLPVPPSSGKARFAAEFLKARQPAPVIRNGPAAPTLDIRPAATEPPPPWMQRERRLKRLSLASALTAALVLIAVGLTLWRFADLDGGSVKGPPVEDPLLANLMQRNLSLAGAKTSRQRLDALAETADDLHKESRSLAGVASAEDLDKLAQLYRKVVRDGIVVQAKLLPPADRPLVLNRIARRLAEAEMEAESLAARVGFDSAASLRDMAAAAREGNQQLLALLRGEKT